MVGQGWPASVRRSGAAESIEQTRERILAATRNLLVHDGFRSTSLDEIARAADVARATVHYLRQAFLAGCRFWAAEHPLIRTLTGLAAVDGDIERVVADVQQHRLPLLHEAWWNGWETRGTCPPPWGRAAHWTSLWMLSSFEAFDQLFAGRQLPLDDVADILADVAVRALVVRSDGSAARH